MTGGVVALVLGLPLVTALLTQLGASRLGWQSARISIAGATLTFAAAAVLVGLALAGCSMLVRQYFTDGFYPSGAASPSDAFTPTGALVKAVMLNSTVDMTGVSGYPSNLEGWGRVLLEDGLYFPGDTRRLYVEDVRNASGLTTGQSTEYAVDVASSGQPLKIALTWVEPAGAAGASNPVVNDLTEARSVLEVVDGQDHQDLVTRATVRSCLHGILGEEWEHHRYAVRDLDALEARPGPPT